MFDEVARRRHADGVEFVLLATGDQALVSVSSSLADAVSLPPASTQPASKRGGERDPLTNPVTGTHHSLAAGRYQIGDVQAISWIASG